MKNLIKKSFLMALFTSMLTVVTAQQWDYLGSAAFSEAQSSYTDVATYNGEVYVVYRDAAYDKKVSVMKFNGNNWVPVGNLGFSPDEVSDTKIAIDNSGVVYVAFKDDAVFNRPTVMKFENNIWSSIGDGVGGHTADYLSLEIHGGVVYLAFQKENEKAVVMKYTGSWEYMGNENGISAGNARYLSLAVNESTGEIYLGYQDNYTLQQKATVRKYDGTDWINIGLPSFTEEDAPFVSLDISSSGMPYIAFKQNYSGTLGVMSFDGSDWNQVGTVTSGQTVSDVSLEMINNTPFVAFVGTPNKASVLTFDGDEWVFVGESGFTEEYVDYTSLVADNNSNLFVAFTEGSSLGSKASVKTFETGLSAISNYSTGEITVFPNPATNKINIDLSELNNVDIRIIDISGKTLFYKENINQKLLSLDLDFTPNIYILQIVSEEKSYVIKLIIQ
ncbi:MAG: T9SS type A sorting domain-containing protein [Bacteroidota bacterium]